jgi:hypothetical protein
MITPLSENYGKVTAQVYSIGDGRGKLGTYVTKHEHDAATCQAGHPEMGPTLLQMISDENASKMGIKVQGDAVVGGHTFYMIVDAPNMEVVQQFMGPFTHMGTVETMEASSCAQVVARGNCGPMANIWTSPTPA